MHSKLNVILVGYSGHAYVVIDILKKNHRKLEGYCEINNKIHNPYKLKYLGNENNLFESHYQNFEFFVAIGDNKMRNIIFLNLFNKKAKFTSVIHPNATLSSELKFGEMVLIAGGCTINPFSKIGNGVICNTGASIDHECQIGDFSHIGPNAVLCGNVKVGIKTFIGANAVIKEGVSIGDNSVIGAGSVILKNVPNNSLVVGNPGKIKSIK